MQGYTHTSLTPGSADEMLQWSEAALEGKLSSAGNGLQGKTQPDSKGNVFHLQFMHMVAPVNFKPGQPIAIGEKLGEIGTTGESTGPHPHWQAYTIGPPKGIPRRYVQQVQNTNTYFIHPEYFLSVIAPQLNTETNQRSGAQQ